MKKLFFSVSNDVIDEITELYNFAWPAASAMWNFRWQVKGFVNEVGRENVTDKNLLDRFDWGSGIHGVNIREAVLEKTWSEQQEQFAKFILTNLIAIYEGWIDNLQEILGFDDDYAKWLQFPSGTNRRGVPRGVRPAIAHIVSTRSSTIENAFCTVLASHKNYSLAQLENLLICFRFFKECRNSLIHRGGRANQDTYDSYQAYIAISRPEDLKMKEKPEQIEPVVVGQKVKLSLRGVVGLGDVIIKLVTTLDAELSISAQAENELTLRLREWSLSKAGKAKNSLKKDSDARSKQIARILRSLEFPEPSRTDEIEALLLQQGILKKNYA